MADVSAAIDAIHHHLRRGDLSDGLVFDAVRVRLIENGRGGQGSVGRDTGDRPDLPWAQIAAMRDQLAHRYFDTSHAIVAVTIANDLPELEAAARRMQNEIGRRHS